MKDKKNFVIISNHCLGDAILTNSLVQNIKRIYEDSNIIMVVAPYLAEFIRYLKDVDDVYVWDRYGKDQGFIKMIKYINNFPYKNIYASFPIYGTDRPVMLARLLGSKYVLCLKQKFFSNFRNSKYPIIAEKDNVQKMHLQLLSGITKEQLIDVPNVIELPEGNCALTEGLKDYFVIIPANTKKVKEFPLEITVDILTKCPNKKFVFVGSGNFASEYSKKLAEYNFKNLIDISNKTSLLDAAYVIKNAKAVISSDTGLLHLSCALNKPTVALFFQEHTKRFIPREDLYNCITYTEDYNTESILDSVEKVIKKGELEYV